MHRLVMVEADAAGLLVATTEDPLSQIPFATESDARAAAKAAGRPDLLPMEIEGEGGFEVWQTS